MREALSQPDSSVDYLGHRHDRTTGRRQRAWDLSTEAHRDVEHPRPLLAAT
jgi:hypothetical protein